MQHKHQKITRFIIGLSVGLCIAVIAGVGFVITWVATGPRSVDNFSAYIERSFHEASPHYSLKIEQIWLVWDTWKHPIDIQLHNIKVLNEQGQIFASFPEISIGLDLFSLPFGQVLPKSVTIMHPIISLFQNEDHSINFGFRQEPMVLPDDSTLEAEPSPEEITNTAPLAAVLAPMLTPDSHSTLRKLRYISIRNADVRIRNKHTGVFFRATHVGFSAKRDRSDKLALDINGHLRYGEYQSLITAGLMMDANHPTIDGKLDFRGVEPSALASFFSDNPALSMVKLPLSGTANITLDKQGILQRSQFAVESGAGEIKSDRLISPLPINWAHIEGQISNNASDIQIDALRANLDNILVEGNGVVSLNNDDAAIRANLNIKNIPAEKVALLWPPELSPLSREWVVSNITEGTVPEADAKINIQFGDRKQPSLPKQAIDANIVLQDGKIRYLPDHPPVTKVQGNIHIDGVSLDASLAAADYMKDTKLSKGHVIIDDLNADNPYIKVTFDADTSAKDVVHILSLPRLKHAQRLNLNADAIEGTAKGTAALGFNFFVPHDANGNEQEPDVDFKINGQVSGISQNAFMKKFDIKNAIGSFAIDNTSIEYKGSGIVNGATVNAMEVKYLFKPENGLDTFIDVKSATAPVEALPRFGYPSVSYLQGTLGVKVNVKQGGDTELYDASLDLTNTAVNKENISWDKPEKEPATLDIVAEKKADALTITSLHLKGKNTDAKGTARLNKELTGFQSLILDKCLLYQTNLTHLDYEVIDGGYKLEAIGKSADLSGWMSAQDKEEPSFSFEHFPSLQFKSDIGQVILGKKRVVSNMKGDMTCNKEHCSSADISGKTDGGKTFSFRILRNPKGQRQVSLHAEDAGAFLKAFGVYDNMEGGDLALTGNFNEAKDNALNGRFDIRNYTLKDAPVLAKILSLASLTGFFDTLQGKGIAFDRMTAPYSLRHDIIALSKAKMYGSAIGMTAEGTITMPKTTYNLQGTVVPSYTLNSMAGKVPLVGQLLTGGDGGGIFAARYSVTGTEKNPDVSVNPLSILTPGFLRGLFDVFDTPEKPKDDDKDSDDE